MSKVKPKDEGLKVQVLLAVYQTDIQTSVAYIFGIIAFLVAIIAIQYQVTSMSTFVFQIVTFVNAILIPSCIYFMNTAFKRYKKNRKALDDLRLKYC